MKTIITKIENNRIAKFLEVEDEIAEETLTALLPDFPGAFIYSEPYSPDLYVTGNEVSFVPLITLLDIKASKNKEINLARLNANLSTFTHAGKVFACDQLSRGDIDGINGYVGTRNGLPPGWVGGWKAADNSILPIPDVAAWNAFYDSMIATGQANFMHSQTLKAALEAAETEAEIIAIQW